MLTDRGIVVTRPVGQAEGLCRLLKAQGARAFRFPTLDIRPPRDPRQCTAVIGRLDEFDLAIFISANAVDHAMALIGNLDDLPDTLQLAVIGKASARALAQYHRQPDLLPERDFSSEGLLALPQLRALDGRKVVIFRGEGGRGLLGDSLRERGAQVTYTEVYRRAVPRSDPADLLRHWRRGEIHAVTVTSNESLQNLHDMLDKPGRLYLLNTPLVVISPRAAELARNLGFQGPVAVAEEAGDAAVVAALGELFEDDKSAR